MGLILNNNNINKLYYGGSEVSKVYLGTTQVYPVEPDSFIPNPDFTTFNNYQNLTSGNGRYLAYGDNALPIGADGYQDGCKLDYGQMIDSSLTGLQILRIVIKNIDPTTSLSNEQYIVSTMSSNSTRPWNYIFTGQTIDYGTSIDDWSIGTGVSNMYLDVAWDSAGGGPFPNAVYSTDTSGNIISVIGSDNSGLSFFDYPSRCGIGYRVRSYSASTQWNGSAGILDLYESGWYRAESVDAYNENPNNVTLVKRIMVAAT